jgi:hypothetical protein
MALVACGDNADLFPNGDHYKLEFASLADGEIITRPAAENAGTYLFFRISGDVENASSLTLTTDLYNAAGDLVVRKEKISPSINVDTAIELSAQLASGQYEIDLTLLRKDAFLVKETRSFFLVKHPPVIQGILSYPLVITPHSPVLLIADVKEPADLNQYLRWKQGKKIIAKGLLSEGYNQILWEAPDVDGVSSVTVEVFPFPPVGADYPFPAQSNAAAELFISSREKEQVSTDSRPHYSLFDIYVSALREREKAASGLRQPHPVIRDEAIGMRFDGRTGFACSELVAPVRSRSLTAWNLVLGVTFEGDNTGRRIFSLAGADKAFTLEGAVVKEGEPVLRLTSHDKVYLFPSGLTKLAPGVRTLLSISVIPSAAGWRVVWKQDGAVVSDTRQVVILEPGDDKGRTVLGGENSARCVIDTFDVFIE